MNYEANEPLPPTMQAVVCYGPGDYRLQEWTVPEPGPEEVVIRVHAVGICASDLKCYQGAVAFWGDGESEGYCQPPVIPGHEFVGEVVALGEGAGVKYGLALGDMAVSEQIVPPGPIGMRRGGSTGCAQSITSTGFVRRHSGLWRNT